MRDWSLRSLGSNPTTVSVMNKKYYIVWNEAKTQGIIVDEYSLAYEARKGSESNCYDENGNQSLIAVAFCDQTGDDNCTIQEIIL